MIRFIVELFYKDEPLWYACFGTLALAAFLICVYYIVLWRLKRQQATNSHAIHRYKTRPGCLILTIALLPFLLIPAKVILQFTVIESWARSLTFRDREVLIQAIEDYKARTEKYPETLDELVPLDIPQLPTLPNGNSYSYHTSNNEYVLSYVFPGLAPVYCTYKPSSLFWYCD